MKILLVGINSKFIHSNLAIRYLEYYTKDLDVDIWRKEYTINDMLTNILSSILEEKADLICFSTYIWNIEFVKKISELIKIVTPKTKILYGGPEVSYNPREFLKEVKGDYVIEGEGEATFRETIIALKNDTYLKEILGLYYKEGNEIIYGGKRENIDMNSIVFPYSNEEDLNNKIIYYEASRGCPFRCKYCLSSVDRNIRYLSLDRVKEELKYFVDRGVSLVKFVDRTFNVNPAFSSAIWEYLIKLDGETSFHFEISAKLLNKEQIEILSRAKKGMFQFEVGVQTTNKEVLKNINREGEFFHIKEKVIEIKKLQNIKQHLDLIAGLPGENYESFINSFNMVYSLEPEELQLGFLKILKGSPMFIEKDIWDIKHSPYPPYEVLKTDNISYEELQKLKNVEKIVDKYYNSNKFNIIIKYLTSLYTTPFEFYFRISLFFKEMGYFSRPLSNNDYYRALLQFYGEEKGEVKGYFSEILKYEFLIHNKKRGIPDFIGKNISKEENIYVKDIVVKKGININKQDLFIEKFNINISTYLEEGKISEEDFYMILSTRDDKEVYYLSNEEMVKF